MSNFTDKEYSKNNSEPLECYHIFDSDYDEEYFYTNHPENYTLDGVGEFSPAIIRRGRIIKGDVPLGDSIELTIDSGDIAIRLNSFRFGKSLLYVRAYRAQYGISDNFYCFFDGQITNIDIGKSTSVINATEFSFRKNSDLNRVRSFTTCPFVVYGEFCKANKSLFTYNGTISGFGSSENIISSSVFSGKQKLMGSVYSLISKEKRIIVESIDDTTVRLVRPFSGGGNIGDALIFTVGCLKTIAYCRMTMNNAKNFGGYPEIPVDDPYQSIRIRRYR